MVNRARAEPSSEQDVSCHFVIEVGKHQSILIPYSSIRVFVTAALVSIHPCPSVWYATEWL